MGWCFVVGAGLVAIVGSFVAWRFSVIRRQRDFVVISGNPQLDRDINAWGKTIGQREGTLVFLVSYDFEVDGIPVAKARAMGLLCTYLFINRRKLGLETKGAKVNTQLMESALRRAYTDYDFRQQFLAYTAGATGVPVASVEEVLDEWIATLDA